MSEFDDLRAEFLNDIKASGPAPELDIFDFAQKCLQQCMTAPSSASLEQLPTVIAIYEAALEMFTDEAKDAATLAYILNNLALAYTHVRGRDRRGNLQKAIETLEQLATLQQTGSRLEDRAMAQANLGVAYMEMGAYDDSAVDKALVSFRSALKMYEELRSPKYSARLHLNLALVYSDLRTLSRESRFNLVINHCNQAEAVFEIETTPIEWARLQAIRGNAMLRLGGSSDQDIRSAILSYQNALRVYNEWDLPSDWEAVQTDLAGAYRALKTGKRTENLLGAIRAYEAALRVVSQPNSPERWTSLKCEMAATWMELADGHSNSYVAEAIRAYEEVRVYLPAKDYPDQWRAVMDNLAQCYLDMAATDAGENYQKAIDTWEEVARIDSRTGKSVSWATIQMSLGYAHARLAQATETKSNLIRALEHFKAAQKVLQACEYPRHHGHLQELISLTSRQLRDLGLST